MKLLLVEDEKDLNDLLVKELTMETLMSLESERTSRIIDSDGGSSSMEKRKREGYF